jgi:hypothetical protein
MAEGSRMKVKLFWKNVVTAHQDRDPRAFEDEINAWLGENPHIRVVDIRQTSSGGNLGPSLVFISVWYEENA